MRRTDIGTAAARLRWAVLIILGLLMLLHVGTRIDFSDQSHFRIVNRIGKTDAPGLGLVSDLGALLFAVALWRLAGMLGLIARGEYFSRNVINRFRGFSSFLLLSALCSALLMPIVVLTQSVRPQIHLDFRDVWSVCVSTLLFLFARLMEEARRLDQDLADIV